MTRMDRWIEPLRPEDGMGAIYLLYLMEKYGQISPVEAAQWRRRIGGWAEYRSVDQDAWPNGRM
jgi:hypothetical protein